MDERSKVGLAIPHWTIDEGAPQPANQFSVNQAVGDWAVRCALTTVKSPAPCDIVQGAVNQDSKLRVMSFSLAYVPSRDAYAMQVVVPTGVALSRGLTLAAGNRSLNGAKFNRCERDGCYVEMLIDNPTVLGLPSIHNEYWDPFWKAIVENDLVMCLHIGGGFQAINMAPDAPIDYPGSNTDYLAAKFGMPTEKLAAPALVSAR